MAPVSAIQLCLLLLLSVAGICLAEIVSLRTTVGNRVTDLSTARAENPRIQQGHRFAPGGQYDEFDLLDVVLLASVDGKLHALNRTSGEVLWSMAGSEGSAPATLGPLIRTEHPDIDPDVTDDDSPHREVYAIEPQSGDIYVMSTPDSPLQRLPFSMAQLVDMSPFFYSGDDDTRAFIGKKETSLLLLNLQTGRVRTVSSECPWNPFADISDPPTVDDLDLDELDGTKPPKPSSVAAEVFIGRTDYHLSISSSSTPIVHKLSFSTYGPNNQDAGLQAQYRHTPDNTYIQPLSRGEVISVQAASTKAAPDIMDAPRLWGQSFSQPIVAILDVLNSPSRKQPFVLLQPRLRLQDILPTADLKDAARLSELADLDSAYVGMVEESGSLFAMSSDRYPLVVFGAPHGNGRTIDPAVLDWDSSEFDTSRDLPSDVASVSKYAKLKRLQEACNNGSNDLRCLTGVRKLGSSESRVSRLLDGAPTVLAPPLFDTSAQDTILPNQSGNASITAPVAGLTPDNASADRLLSLGPVATTSVSAAFALAFITLLVWLGLRRWSDTPQPSPAIPAPAAATLQITGDAPSPQVPSTEESILVPDASSTVDAATLAKPLQLEATPNGKKVLFAPDVDTPKSRATAVVETVDDVVEGEDSDKEADTQATPGKRKGLRRKRGKKKKAGLVVDAGVDDEDVEAAKESEPLPNGAANGNGYIGVSNGNGHIDIPDKIDIPNGITNLVLSQTPTPTPSTSSLTVTDTILGFGSSGTVVFKGSLQGRAVAVKRLLQDFVTLASREVNVLQESDDHPNVIRYYYQESHANFLYIALELCPASLADVIEHPDMHRDIIVAFDPKRALRQITSGLRHLHALKIIHRDIKPQNILISHAKKGVGENAGHRMLISDFGLCKKLEVDQTSFYPTAHGAMAAGTVGWRAPEILRGEVKLDDSGTEDSQSSRGSVGTPTQGTGVGKPTRLTKSVDIFALGCLYYYVLTNGSHPFGDRFEREVNILKNAKSLEGLERFGEEGAEGTDLIGRMLSPEAYDRPDCSTCLLHPYFWDPGKRLTFLQDASDRFEIMCRDPRDPYLVLLETDAYGVVGNDWHSRLDKLFIENLGKFRKYDGRSVQDLLRALRNKKHHYQDLPDNVKRLLGSMPEGFLSYFTRRFPQLFLHVHRVIAASPMRSESMFRTYFELTD